MAKFISRIILQIDGQSMPWPAIPITPGRFSALVVNSLRASRPWAKAVSSSPVKPEDDPARKPLRIGVLPEFFQGLEESLSPKIRRDSDEFDYGYALTVHKAQGSQWNHVILFDESFAFREHRNRWLYTGITRAAERLTIVV